MKNSFRGPKLVQVQIEDDEGTLVGTLRVKPSGLLWKPKEGKFFRMVPLDKFAEWVESKGTRATK